MHAWKRLVALGVLAGCALLAFAPAPSRSGQQTMKSYVLFNGTSSADSTPRASYWVPIRGASRVMIRFFTAHAGAYTGADSAFVDSVSAWSTQFGDSVSFVAKDSLGTITTLGSWGQWPNAYYESWNRNSSGVPYNTFPMVLDSTAVSGDGADSTRFVAVYHTPASTQKLSFTATKGGWYQYVYPLSPTVTQGNPYGSRYVVQDAAGPVFLSGYMRIRYTPYTRVTFAGYNMTAPNRTRGLNKPYGVAYVYYANQP